jgi:ankyrin repeat protein
VLLEIGKAQVEASDNGGSTALMLAGWYGHETTVRVLLETGKAQVEAKDNRWFDSADVGCFGGARGHCQSAT